MPLVQPTESETPLVQPTESETPLVQPTETETPPIHHLQEGMNIAEDWTVSLPDMTEGFGGRSMFRELQKAVNRKPVANGLAIIVANEDSVKPDHKHLPGARRDLDTMKQTFEKLKFATFPILNSSRDELVQVIQAAVSTQMKYPKSPDPQAYGRMVFYFSGHGDGSCIYTHDGAVNLQDEVFPPFLPEKSPHLAKVPKFFFIDTCRGAGTDDDVKVCVYPPQQFQSRGGVQIGEKEGITSSGNYLLSCSNLPNTNGGEFWTQELSRQLCNPDNIKLSVYDVLGLVNKSLIDKMSGLGLKQPVLESTLIGEPVRLLKEAADIESDPEKEVYFAEQQHIILGSGGIQTDPVLYTLPLCFPTYPGALLPSVPVQRTGITEQKCFNFSSGAVVQSHCDTSMTPVSDYQYHMHSDHTSDPHAYGILQNPGLGQGAGYQRQYSERNIQYHFPSQASLKDGNEQGHYRGLLNHFSQTGVITDYHDQGFRETYSDGRTLYRSFLHMKHVSTQKEIIGTSRFMPSKSEAKEDAARDAYEQIIALVKLAQGQQARSRGGSESTREDTLLVPSQASSVKDGNEQGYYRGLLNHFSQTGEITDYHNQGCREKYSDGRTLYQSFLYMKHVATQKQISATSQWMPSKSEAKEDAARDAYKQIDALINGQQGRGGSESSRESNTSRATGPGIVTPRGQHMSGKFSFGGQSTVIPQQGVKRMSAPEIRNKQAIGILQKYPDIDSTQLGIEDSSGYGNSVLSMKLQTQTTEHSALMDGVADKWMSVGLLFGLSYKTLQICELSDTFDEKVNGMVEAWLAKKYDVESFGEPSWRKLVEVVASRAGGSHQALAAKIARQHPIVNEAECYSSGAAAVRVESVPAPQLPADVLREGDLKMLVNELRGVAYKWMVLGQQLGLSMGELQNISASPMLLSGAPVTFFQQVLYIWLSFEPPTHSWPTITVLCEGLSSPAVEEEVLATQVRQRLSQRTCSIVTPPRTPQTSTSQSAIKRESPTAKVWKQRLKEYFDKKLKGKGVVKIRYENKQNQKDGRWSSIVYCPEIGMAEGDKDCPRKPAAEHSAAYNALKKLNALT